MTWSLLLLFVGCLFQQHASVSQEQICPDSCTCCSSEIEVADQTFCLTQSQYTYTGPNNPSADPVTPGVWQGSQWNTNLISLWYDSTWKKGPRPQRQSKPGIPLSRRTPYHLANEAVSDEVQDSLCLCLCLYARVRVHLYLCVLSLMRTYGV